MPQNQQQPQSFSIGQVINQRLAEDPFADARDIYSQVAANPEGLKYLDSFGDVDKALTSIDASLKSYRTFTGDQSADFPKSWGEILTPKGGWTDKGIVDSATNFGKGMFHPFADLWQGLKSMTGTDVARESLLTSLGPLAKGTKDIYKAVKPNIEILASLDAEKFRSSEGGQASGPFGMQMSGDQIAEAGKLLAGLIPFMGPAAKHIGERAGEGNFSGSGGELAGLLLAGGGRKPAAQGASSLVKKIKPESFVVPAEFGTAGALAATGHPVAATLVGVRGVRDMLKNLFKKKEVKEYSPQATAHKKAMLGYTPSSGGNYSPPTKSVGFKRNRAMEELTGSKSEPKKTTAPTPSVRWNKTAEPPENPSTTIRKRLAGVDPSMSRVPNADKIRRGLGGRFQKKN